MGSDNDAWQGPDEVLWKIFSFLDLEDLFSCEAVCVAWRSSFNEGIWRNALRKTAKSEDGGWRTWGRLVACRKRNGASNKDCCEAIQQVRSNWQLGKYRMHVKHCTEENVSFLDMDYDNFLVMKCSEFTVESSGLTFHTFQAHAIHTCEINKKNFYQSQILLENRIYSRAIPETHLNSRCKMFQTRIFIWDYFGREIIVYDSKDGSVVSTLNIPNNGSMEHLFLDYRNRLLTIGYDCQRKPELLVWQMNDEGQFTLTHQESLKISGGINSCEMNDQFVRIKSCKFDDQYVAIKSSDAYEKKHSFHFFSLNTMKIESSLTDIPAKDSDVYVYGSGLLFNLRSGYIRVLDVALNKQIATILTPNHSYNPPEIWEEYDYDADEDYITYSPFWPKIFTTSEYVIIHAKLANQKFKTVLEIYKLEEIRHTKVDICKPHKTIQLPKGAIDSTNVFVDETKIVLIEECKETNDLCIVSRIIDFS